MGIWGGCNAILTSLRNLLSFYTDLDGYLTKLSGAKPLSEREFESTLCDEVPMSCLFQVKETPSMKSFSELVLAWIDYSIFKVAGI